jgi:hypothetical protein
MSELDVETISVGALRANRTKYIIADLLRSSMNKDTNRFLFEVHMDSFDFVKKLECVWT